MAELLYCSFCGKAQTEVRKLIAGPTVFICNECTDLCYEIAHEHDADAPPPSPPPISDIAALHLALQLDAAIRSMTAAAAALRAYRLNITPKGPGELVGFPNPGDEK